MRTLAFVAALLALMATPVGAQPHREFHGGGGFHGGYNYPHHGYGGGLLPGIIGGALLWNLFHPNAVPPYDMPPDYPCLHYPSYDPQTRTFVGDDGVRRACP